MSATPTFDAPSHQMRLLEVGRCRRCAERVSRALILRGEVCPHCESKLSKPSADVLDRLQTRQIQWRVIGYGLVAVTSFVSGLVPLLQSVVQVAALFILHVIVLRRGLVWLSPGRRIFARLNMKLFAALVAVAALFINVAIAPFLGISAFVLAAVGPLLTAIYVEGGLVILRHSLRRESRGQGLHVVEWALPAGLLVALLAVLGASVAMVATVLHLLAATDIPTIAELSEMLLELF